MPVQVNPLILQDLFNQMLEDLKNAQDQLYKDGLSYQMKVHCQTKRLYYKKKFEELMNQK